MDLNQLATALAGRKLPGGCDDCNAYQTLHPDPDHPHITHLRIHHDDTCPFLAGLR